jgi:putative ABC transport system ATP-binding protein
MNLLQSFNKDKGITIIMVTHEKEMAAYASRIIRFRDGGIDRTYEEKITT